jgi:hypothetical protein
MKNHEFNLEQLEKMALSLGNLLPQVTFVGGCTTCLLVDEAARFGVRETDDVDVIVDIATVGEYYKFGEELRKLGFREDTEGFICRWLIDKDAVTLKLDVMPIDEKILGFSNRWYKEAIDEATEFELPGGAVIRVVEPAYFIATKFEAYMGRGQGDYYCHDLEDIIFILENRISQCAVCSC